MKVFARAGSRLRTLPLQARIVYSVFLAFTLAALAMTAWLGAQMLGPDLSGTQEYYAGAASSRPAATHAADGGGPQLDLPDDMLAVEVRDPMPTRKLLEVTHFHLFSMPVYLVILSHLFMLSGWSGRAKVFWISAASLGVALHIAAPWLVRSGAAGAGLVYGASGAALALSFLVMSGVPLVEMWQARPGQPSTPAATPAASD